MTAIGFSTRKGVRAFSLESTPGAAKVGRLTIRPAKGYGQWVGKAPAVYGLLMLIAVALGAGLYSVPACGQAVNGSIVGTVTDSSGAVVPLARVTITSESTSVPQSATSDARGYYSFPDLPPGVYKVAVEQQGFATIVRTGVALLVNSTVRVDIILRPGAVTQTVTVQSKIPLLQTDTAQTGSKLTAVQAEQLPLGTNRNFQNLINLVPGATRSAFNHSNFFNPQNSLNNEVNGTSSLTNNFQIQGVNDNERTGLLQVYIPPIEAIQDVDVTTSNYDAEQGTALGAVTNVILKSGTNHFHGSAYEIYNGQALNSRSFFDRGPQGTPFIKPPHIYNY